MDLKDNIDILKSVKSLSLVKNNFDISILNIHLKYILDYMPEITDKSNLLLTSAYVSRDRLTRSIHLTSLSNTEIRLSHVTDLLCIINLKLTVFIYNVNEINNYKTRIKTFINRLFKLKDNNKNIKMSLLESLVDIYESIYLLEKLLKEIDPELKRILAKQ